MIAVFSSCCRPASRPQTAGGRTGSRPGGTCSATGWSRSASGASAPTDARCGSWPPTKPPPASWRGIAYTAAPRPAASACPTGNGSASTRKAGSDPPGPLGRVRGRIAIWFRLTQRRQAPLPPGVSRRRKEMAAPMCGAAKFREETSKKQRPTAPRDRCWRKPVKVRKLFCAAHQKFAAVSRGRHSCPLQGAQSAR